MPWMNTKNKNANDDDDHYSNYDKHGETNKKLKRKMCTKWNSMVVYSF